MNLFKDVDKTTDEDISNKKYQQSSFLFFWHDQSFLSLSIHY